MSRPIFLASFRKFRVLERIHDALAQDCQTIFGRSRRGRDRTLQFQRREQEFERLADIRGLRLVEDVGHVRITRILARAGLGDHSDLAFLEGAASPELKDEVLMPQAPVSSPRSMARMRWGVPG